MSKPIRELTISKDSTIRQAMEAIQRGACGMALVMDEDRRLLGVMTDGDVAARCSPAPRYRTTWRHTW